MKISKLLPILFFLPLSVHAQPATPGFSFTNEELTYTQDFNEYRGSLHTLPEFFSVTWDQGRTETPFTGVGDFATSDPEETYGGFSAFSSGDDEYSFGFRERAPVDLRDGRLFFSFTNNTDQPVSMFEVSYDVEAWFIGDRRNRIRLKYDDDPGHPESFDEDIFSTDNPSPETTPGTKVNGSLAANRITVSGIVDITALERDDVAFEPLAPGETAYFRWQFSNADDDDGDLRSGLAVNNLVITALIETDETENYFSFTNDLTTYSQNFNGYRGSLATLPPYFSVTWDKGLTAAAFTGVGNFATSDPDLSYGGFTAFTAGEGDYSFGIREREPVDLRDGRLFFAFENNTEEPVSEFEVRYDVEAWFIGDRRNRIRLKYDDDPGHPESFDEDIFSTDNPSTETTPGTKVDGSLAENRITVSGILDITTLERDGVAFEPLAPGESAYFRWQFSNADDDEGDLRSGLAINNLSISVPGPTSVGGGAETPRKVTLEQNYPNPFNPATNISFSLTRSEHVQLHVYNMQGQRVAMLVDGMRSSGSHTVMFHAENLASGLYIYRLQTGSASITKRMMLIK